jgi:glycosyltransferase involved in cell wall biosynthesis
MATTLYTDLDVAVLLPCYNEALTIADTIDAFRQILPKSKIYVYDNNSTDNTAEIAQQHGAIVGRELHPGKGNVVRRMFADIDADIYLLADGDCTYDCSKAPEMINKLFSEHLDMVVGVRVPVAGDNKVYRLGHTLGNKAFSTLISKLFGDKFTDVFSGYRVFSRRFVKSFPSKSKGFEIESELSIHTLELRLPSGEVKTPYRSRPEGSTSKLRSYHDGFRILWRIILLLKEVRPLLFFSILATLFAAISIGIYIPVLIEYFNTGLIPRLPTTILSTGIMLIAILSIACGLILDNVGENKREFKRLFYLTLPYLKK